MDGRISIKGCEQLLTPNEVAVLLQLPVRYVVRNLIKSGALKAKRISAREYRIRPCDFTAFVDPNRGYGLLR